MNQLFFEVAKDYAICLARIMDRKLIEVSGVVLRKINNFGCNKIKYKICYFPFFLGYRTEQDIYVRLIDSQTGEVCQLFLFPFYDLSSNFHNKLNIEY